MAEIRNLTRNGETFYPLTCSDAVLNRDGEPLGIVNDIFDISEYNASGTPPVLAKYDTLSLALAAVPDGKKKGGMTIRYVQTSDNKYVQCRLMKDSWSINTEDWAICSDTVLIEYPGFIAVLVDKEGKIAFAIQKDGNVLFGTGVPKQVIEYVTELLFEKVDKEEGKSLIDEDVADRVHYIENPEWMRVIVDEDGKVVAGILKNGTLYVNNLYYKNIDDLIEIVDSKANKDRAEINNLVVYDSITLSDTVKNSLRKTLLDIVTDNKKQEFSTLFLGATGDVESFMFFSDPHFFRSYDECTLRDDIDSIGYISEMKEYFDNTPTDFIISGGDWLTNHKQSIAVKDLAWVDGFMTKLFNDKYYPIYGNHDNNYQGELDETDDISANDGALSNQQMINLWFRKWDKMYYTFKGSNSTFYIFDSGIDWDRTMNAYRWEQVDWFANSLLSNTDLNIIIGIHIIQNDASTFGTKIAELADNVTKIADAFNGRQSITLNDITYNFSNSVGKVRVAICGHTHYDATATLNNIPVLCIKNATAHCFDMILIDYGTNTLKTVRVGSGSNRQINLV